MGFRMIIYSVEIAVDYVEGVEEMKAFGDI